MKIRIAVTFDLDKADEAAMRSYYEEVRHETETSFRAFLKEFLISSAHGWLDEKIHQYREHDGYAAHPLISRM